MTRVPLALFALTLAASAPAADWQEGKHYTVLPEPQRTQVAPGKVEVMEVFSYGCPACNHFRGVMAKIKAALPSNAEVVYLPPAWHPNENWPNLQRAYFTAQMLGVAEKTHEAMFDAVWTTGELAVFDAGGEPRRPLPTLEDIAKFYQRVAGVKVADFLAAANSSAVDAKIHQADVQISIMQVPGTPCLVINGKYRINNRELSGEQDFVDLVKFLVARESPEAPAPAKKPTKKSTKKKPRAESKPAP